MAGPLTCMRTRVFFREVDGEVGILAKSGKEEEPGVIKHLLNEYGK